MNAGSSSSSVRADEPAQNDACTREGAGDPYALLNVPRSASSVQIRKAYFLLARRVHPDRNPSPDAAAAFQALQKAYGILSDPAKRRLFDKTGCTDQDSEAFWEAYQQYRTIYPEVNKEDIEAFAKKYRGSEEEKEDLRKFYNEKGGDVSTLQAHIMLSRPEDAKRFVAFFDSEINNGGLDHTEAYEQTKSRCGEVMEEENLEDGKDDNNSEELEHDEDEEDSSMSDFIVNDDASDIDIDSEKPREKESLSDESHGANGRKKRRRRGSEADSPSSSTASSLKVEGLAKKQKTAKRQASKTKDASKGKSSNRKSKSSGDGDSMDALREMMMQRARDRHESMMDHLAAKYC